MSKYTTEVRTICENLAGLDESVGYNSIKDVIANSRTKVFDFDYPIFDSNYKEVLETKILKHYYTNEICCETVGLWKLFLDETMNRIMPYYNQLYESALIKYNPLTTTEMNTIHNNINTSSGDSSHNTASVENDNIDKTNNNNELSNIIGNNSTSSNNVKSGTQNTTTNSTDKYSDTPQGTISNLSNDTYLTNATINNGNNSQQNNEIGSAQANDKTQTTQTAQKTNNEKDVHTKLNQSQTADKQNNVTLDNYIEQVAGRGVAGAELILKLRETFLNIDQLIIDNLHDLFMLIW